MILMMFSCVSIVYGSHRIVDPGDFGDPNGDGHINVSDVSLIMKYIAKWDLSDKTFIEDAADVTHDEKIDLYDTSKLLKYIAKWPLWHK